MTRIVTNKFGLPSIIEEAVKLDLHKSAGDLSCSQLIDSPRVRLLKKMNDYSEDVSEMLYALMGTAMHHVLERAHVSDIRKHAFMLTIETVIERAGKAEGESKDKLNKISEGLKKLMLDFFPEIESEYVFELTLRLEVDGTVIYGTFDLYHKPTKTLYDYKACSVYQWMYPEARKKWMMQTNIYASLLEKAGGYPVEHIKIVALFRDWSASKIVTNKDYPPRQMMEIPVTLHPAETRMKYILGRVKKHKEAEDSGELPLCTGTERWATADIFAVKTPGVKKAFRVFDDKSMADVFMLENAHRYKNMFIENRPGSSKRCESFCPVAQFCDQFRLEKEMRLKMSDKE